jgi:hypothetical protein
MAKEPKLSRDQERLLVELFEANQRHEKPIPLAELARRVNRRIGDVERDMAFLQKAGLIGKESATAPIRERVVSALKEMDPNLSETDPAWAPAAFLAASIFLGADTQAIADEMEFDPMVAGVYGERARFNGLWNGPDFAEGYLCEEGGTKFFLDAQVVGGNLKRVNGDKYQMTDAGKAEIEGKLARNPKARALLTKLRKKRLDGQ